MRSCLDADAGADPQPVKTSPQPEDRILLEGPHSRIREARLLFKAIRDFIVGFRTLHFCGPCVTVFGSARIREGHPYYQLGIALGKGSHARIHRHDRRRTLD